MNSVSGKKNKSVGGFRAKSLIIPLAIVLAILHAVIVAMIVRVSYNSNKQSVVMRNYSEYIADATSLLAGSSLLSETARTYILMPETEGGVVNYGPLLGYVEEYSVKRRGSDVVARFEGYDVDKKARDYVAAAALNADKMVDAQLHAIELMRSVYPLPNIPALDGILRYGLIETEIALSDDEKRDRAFELVCGDDYNLYKRDVSDLVGKCNAELKEEQAKISVETLSAVNVTRTVLWIAAMLVIALLFAMFVVFYKLFLSPITGFVNKISKDDPLDESKGIYEVRMLAFSYNKLLSRRNTLENVLRDAAECDALTKLPNRYSFNRAIDKDDESGYSAAVVLFDINYLKLTNDTQGHLAGDALICRSAECILKCFGNAYNNNCFRFGGDEFAAIVVDVSPEDIKTMLEKFRDTQKEYNVSIAYGYEYARDIGDTSLRKLFFEADKKMYANKMDTHFGEFND
ncbi:MAG: GGDEF domain-containing protein [Clostridia bacterium]|nr:GGDEF domain-containing protein [Clostridia bacterium]